MLSDFPHLLNYLTAPDVVIWSAAVASCSIPGVFAPRTLYKKNIYRRKKYTNTEGSPYDNTFKEEEEIVPCTIDGVRWADGSLECDLPISRIKEMFDVNHFIVSQGKLLFVKHIMHELFGSQPTCKTVSSSCKDKLLRLHAIPVSIRQR